MRAQNWSTTKMPVSTWAISSAAATPSTSGIGRRRVRRATMKKIGSMWMNHKVPNGSTNAITSAIGSSLIEDPPNSSPFTRNTMADHNSRK